MLFDTPSISRLARRRGKAYSLIELLIALAFIAFLGGAMIAIWPSLRESSRIDRAEADLHVIQDALESYKSRFGDYPRLPESYEAIAGISNAEEYLCNALNGRIGPKQGIIDVPGMLNNVLLRFESPDLPLSSIVANRILDPWGRAYRYHYGRSDHPGNRFGYILYSLGPDGEASTTLDQKQDDDNVFANQ